MFFKSSIVGTIVLAISASSLATPISKRSVSFNNWNGHNSLSNFDDFYGADNFGGGKNNITLKPGQHLKCHTEHIEIIQQKLAVLREYAKKIITEQMCEVESQIIVLTQHHAAMHQFQKDLTRTTGHYVGYDQAVASHIGSIHDSSGELTSSDLKFKGSNIGSTHMAPYGNNWDNNSSPSSVGAALSLSRQAGDLD